MKDVTLPIIQGGEKSWVFQMWEAILVEGPDGRESNPKQALFEEMPFFHVLITSESKAENERKKEKKGILQLLY